MLNLTTTASELSDSESLTAFKPLPKHPLFINITGNKYNSLTVVGYLGDSKWSCLCDCGKTTLVHSNDLRNGKTKTCGCGKTKALLSKACEQCGEVFHQKRYSGGPDHTFANRKYCSKKCAGVAFSVDEDSKQRRRKSVIAAYGGKCTCCGESEWQFLSLDHINNDGAAHRREVRDVYKWAEDNNYPNTLRVLCFNCNMARAFYGVCPHEIRKSV